MSNQISMREKRKLATYKPLFDTNNKKLNPQYSKDFEELFKDRFYGRQNLINLNIYIKYYLTGRFIHFKNRVFDKKNKNSYDLAENLNFTQDKILELSKQLKIFNEYCSKNNIKLYLFIAPTKIMVEDQSLYNEKNNDKLKQYIKLLSKDNNFSINFLLDELISAKKTSSQPLYYKLDTHMTPDGTYICYKKLMETIEKDFPNLTIQNLDNFKFINSININYEGNPIDLGRKPRCLPINLPIPEHTCKKYFDTEYRYFVHKKSKKSICKTINFRKNISNCSYPKGKNLKILVLGDSFSAGLREILPYSFKDTTLIRPVKYSKFKILKGYKNEINRFKPNIIVIYISYYSLAKLLNLNNLE